MNKTPTAPTTPPPTTTTTTSATTTTTLLEGWKFKRVDGMLDFCVIYAFVHDAVSKVDGQIFQVRLAPRRYSAVDWDALLVSPSEEPLYEIYPPPAKKRTAADLDRLQQRLLNSVGRSRHRASGAKRARGQHGAGDSSGRGDRGSPMANLDGDADYLIEGEVVEHPGDGDNVEEIGEPNPCESDIENSNEDDEAAPRLGPTHDQLAVVVVPPPGVALQPEVAAAAFDGDADDDDEDPFADFDALDGGRPRSPPPLPPPVASTAASSNESHGHAQPQRLPRIATGDRTSQLIIASALGPLYGVVPVRIYFEGRCGAHGQYIARHIYGSRSMLPGSATRVAGPSERDHHAAIVKLFNTHVAPLAPAAGAAAQPPLPPPPDGEDSDLGSDCTYVSIASHELLSPRTSSSTQHSNNTSEGSWASG